MFDDAFKSGISTWSLWRDFYWVAKASPVPAVGHDDGRVLGVEVGLQQGLLRKLDRLVEMWVLAEKYLVSVGVLRSG